MNLDSTTNAATIAYTKTELNKSISSTQIKRASDAGASFVSEMKASSEQKEAQPESAEKTELTSKAEDKKETSKTEAKHADKVSKETSSDTQQITNNDNSSDTQFQGQQWQGQGQNNDGQQNGYTPLSSQIQAYMNANGVDLNFASINSMNATSQAQLSGMVTTVDYSNIQMSETDAKFFADLVAKTDMTAGSIAAEFDRQMQQGNVKMVQSTAKASAALIEALKESSKNHQSFRVDFDKDISVILQVDKGGKINANFIPGDKAVEAYLRNNIDFLRQRFNEENISYGDLTYSQSRRNKQDRERNNNKEQG